VTRRPAHIHAPRDGRPPRVCYVNGVKQERIAFADCRRGFAVQVVYPYEVLPHCGAVRKRRLDGFVVVALA
jgi:hypothetical protein